MIGRVWTVKDFEPSSRLVAAIGVVIAACTAATGWFGFEHGELGPVGVVSESAVSLCFAVGGLVVWRLCPRSRTGLWLLALGLVATVENLWAFRLTTRAPGHDIVAALGSFTMLGQYALAGRVVLGYPSGRLAGRAERTVMSLAWGWVVVFALLMLITRTNDPVSCAGWCYESPVRLVRDRGLYLTVLLVGRLTCAGLALCAFVLLARRLVTGTPRQRRILRFTVFAFAVSLLLFAGFGLLAGRSPPGTALEVFRYVHQWLGVLTLPGVLVAGLLRERLAFASVGSLVSRLERMPSAQYEHELRRILRDPGLRLLYIGGDTGDTDLESAGAPHAPGATCTVTPVGGTSGAVLVHDWSVSEDRELLDAAVAATRLVLDNVHLQEELQHKLDQLAQTRREVEAAALRERARLERDLHDGAQQRFIAVGLGLAELHGRISAEPDQERIRHLVHQIRAGLQDLRRVAHGIRPAVLNDHGLEPALSALGRRAGVPAEVEVRLPQRPPPTVETAAYYVVSEALQNVLKHSPDAHARIEVYMDQAEVLVVEVTDDGSGGAVLQAGRGLCGLVTRVEALDGRLDVLSPPGGGTRVVARIPLDHSSVEASREREDEACG